MPYRQLVAPCRLVPLFLLAILISTIAACKTTSNLSLEDAREISATGEYGFTLPPRAGISTDLVNPKYLEGFGNEACLDQAPKPVNVDRTIEEIQNYCSSGKFPWEKKYCLPDKLFDRGREAMNRGHYTAAITLIKAALAKSDGAQDERYRPHLATSYAAIGDFRAARWSMGGGNSSYFRSQSGQYQVKVNYYVGRASLARIKGDYREAEKFYRKARKFCDKGREITGHVLFYDVESQFLPYLGEVLMMQGRPVDAELVLRESLNRFSYRDGALTNRLRSMAMLGRVFYQEGRYADAEVMLRATIGGYHAYRFNCTLLDLNLAHHSLAKALLALGRPTEALKQFETIQHNMRHTPRIFNIRFANDPDWAYALVADGAYSRAETMLANALKTARGQYGDSHHRTAEIRGLLAVAQYRQSKTKAAGKNFTAALPILLTYHRGSEADSGSQVAFNRRLGRIIETYMAYITKVPDDDQAAAETTFPLADAIRGQSVQQAVMASSSRIAAQDSRLADLVRREQDAGKKITALNAVLLNSKSQPDGGGKRSDTIAKEIEQLRQARAVILDNIEAAFPAYAELTRPRPKTLAAVKAALRPDEALLAFYIGKENSFVWSVPGRGPSGFAVISMGARALEKEVQTVRRSLEPKGTRLDELPDFDVAAAHRLYQALLKPVRPSWKNAKHLIIVPHGSLGHLPFGLLPTRGGFSRSDGKLPLSSYRRVPWLVRDHSITVLPSSGTLITLRSLPATDPTRRAYAGFGDPVFNKGQALMAAAKPQQPGVAGRDSIGNLPVSKDIMTRAIRITDAASLDEERLTSATLEMLTPLPDTRDEVLSIATALKADISQDVFLGQAANETTLKQLDLSNRRVLVFATHGLVPGDLDGLRQPALALSSPAVTGEGKNDGLLTMGEIMGLQLNADWVVLSACNTAAGQGAGSEAVSGLGQAFFYAGTRALLVSNWPVESVSARLLTTELFRQQEADPTLSRAVALQKSMLKLLDDGVRRDPQTGKAAFAYAHPVFWAPFSLVGEGGVR